MRLILGVDLGGACTKAVAFDLDREAAAGVSQAGGAVEIGVSGGPGPARLRCRAGLQPAGGEGPGLQQRRRGQNRLILCPQTWRRRTLGHQRGRVRHLHPGGRRRPRRRGNQPAQRPAPGARPGPTSKSPLSSRATGLPAKVSLGPTTTARSRVCPYDATGCPRASAAALAPPMRPKTAPRISPAPPG